MKTNKQTKSFIKKESNVENDKLTSFVCKQASKESQTDWIVCKICGPMKIVVLMKPVYFVNNLMPVYNV